jgi:hypothetical protein
VGGLGAPTTTSVEKSAQPEGEECANGSGRFVKTQRDADETRDQEDRRENNFFLILFILPCFASSSSLFIWTPRSVAAPANGRTGGAPTDSGVLIGEDAEKIKTKVPETIGTPKANGGVPTIVGGFMSVSARDGVRPGNC